MKIIKITLIFLLFISMIAVSAYAEVQDSTGKINVDNKPPQIIGLQFSATTFYDGDVIYCSASIKDLNNDTLALNASIYDTNHNSTYPNYNLTTSQFICSGQWTDPLGEFCYVGITNITGKLGLWICKFSASDGIANTSSIATANEISITPSTTTTVTSGGGGGGGVKIQFDLRDLKILNSTNTQIFTSFILENKGWKNPIDVSFTEKITQLSTLTEFAENTQVKSLNVKQEFNSTLNLLSPLAEGLYRYEVYAYAVNETSIGIHSEIIFRFSPETGVKQPTSTEVFFGNAREFVTRYPFVLILIIVSFVVLVAGIYTFRKMFK